MKFFIKYRQDSIKLLFIKKMIQLAKLTKSMLVKKYVRLFSQGKIHINPYLQEQLKIRKFTPLKDFQQQTLKVVAQQNQNCFINSCTGSGKTLAYLLPVLNQILNHKQSLMKNKNPQEQKNFQFEKNKRHGALIFTLNKELALQIYRQIRLLDSKNKLNVYRVGPISHFAPVVQLLNKKQKTPEDEDQIADNVETNLIKCVNWTKTDILIGTPQMFYNVMTQSVHNKINLINPKFIVIDEADLLLQIDQNVAKYTQKIIALLKNDKKAPKNIKNFFAQQKNEQQEVKYLMSSSSFPKKINKIPTIEYLQQNFSPIKSVTGINKHRLPQRLDMKYIEIQSVASVVPGEQSPQVDRQKLFYLEKILTDPEKQGNRFIIFCSNKKTVEKVSAFISQKLKRQSVQYFAGLPSDQRSMNLHKFMNQSFDILISTDLGSRGLDFTKPIHTVIEYDLAQNIVNFINRAGRTARNQLPGEIISFVESKNKTFFGHLAEKNSQSQQFDGLFSRKRSYNKLVLKPLKKQLQEQEIKDN